MGKFITLTDNEGEKFVLNSDMIYCIRDDQNKGSVIVFKHEGKLRVKESMDTLEYRLNENTGLSRLDNVIHSIYELLRARLR